MSKSQSNRIVFTVAGSMAKWNLPHDMGSVALDMATIPGVMDAVRAGGVLGEAVVFGIRQTVSNGAAVDRSDANGNLIPHATLWRTKLDGIRRRVETLGRNVWSEAGVGDGGMFRRVLERMAETSADAARLLEEFDNDALSDERKDKIKKTATYKRTLAVMQIEGLDGLDDDLAAL